MSNGQKKESVFSKMIRAGSRTYFLDVKISAKGEKYLSIGESRKVDGEFQSKRIFVFGDDIPKFFQRIKEAAPALRE